MGLFPMFPICEAIINRAQLFSSVLFKYPITKKIIHPFLFISYYIQSSYESVKDNAVKLYYTYVDTNYEDLRVYEFDKFINNIHCLFYSNHRHNTYLTLKSNTQSFKNMDLQQEETQTFINNHINLRNPLLSAIVTIKSKEGDFETSVEVNNLLKPFLFQGNTILGSPAFVYYLIHENVERGIKNDDVKKSTIELCDALHNDKELKDYNIDMTYMSLCDVGVITIPNIQDSYWSMSVRDDNTVILELNDTEY
jgi:hypothetical protein